MAPLAHKYDIPLVLRACEAFLAAEDTAPLSAQAGEPHYVLDWLEVGGWVRAVCYVGTLRC